MTFSRFPTPLVVALTLTSLAACSSGKPATAPTPAPDAATATVAGAAPAAAPAVIQGSAPSPGRNRDRSTLSRDEIRATQYTNLYDVIATLRGNWVRNRSAESINGKSSSVQVYLDTQRLSGVDELRTMMSANIESVRYFDPIAASARWGMDHGAGAIMVTTAKK